MEAVTCFLDECSLSQETNGTVKTEEEFGSETISGTCYEYNAIVGGSRDRYAKYGHQSQKNRTAQEIFKAG